MLRYLRTFVCCRRDAKGKVNLGIIEDYIHVDGYLILLCACMYYYGGRKLCCCLERRGGKT